MKKLNSIVNALSQKVSNREIYFDPQLPKAYHNLIAFYIKFSTLSIGHLGLLLVNAFSHRMTHVCVSRID